MFIGVLGALWARSVPLEPSADAAPPPDKDLGTWLRAVDAAAPPEVGDLVVAAGSQRATAAARWLLAQATSRLSKNGPDRWNEIGDLGALLLRVVERGHGADFPGGQLAIAHSRMLIGLGRHLSSPSSSGDAYQQAAREYTSRGEPLLAALAQLGAATVRWRVLLGGDQGEVHTQLAAIAAVDPAAAAELGPPLDGYLRTVRAIAALRAGTPGNELDQDESHERDAEAVSLFKLAASSSLDDDVAAASRLARLADELSISLGEPGNVLNSIGESLLRKRRWPDAVAVLEECHKQNPQDRDIAIGLAQAWLEMERWDDARSLLVSLLTHPPGPQDADVLQLLQNAAFLRGDPQYQRWHDLLADIDPSRTTAGQLPSPPVEAPREPIRAIFQDGHLQISTDLFELPEDERTAHLTAAIVAGSLDGPQQWTELLDSDPVLAERVMHLLGLERVTAEEAQIRRHIRAGEEHFHHGRFEDAAHEYQAAVDLDPDQATALLYLGDTWYRRGAYELAQAYFEESLAVAPSPQAFRFLGDAVLHSGGLRERARQCYEEALRLDPSYGGAKVALQQLNDAEREEERSAWLGERVPSPAGRPAAAAVGSSPETPDGDDAAATPSSSVSPGLRWSDMRSPKPLPGQEWTAPQPREPPVLSQLPVVDEAPASDPSQQDAPPQDARADSVGDRLVRAVAEQDPDSIVTVIDDDNSFSRWIAAASPDTIARAIFTVLSIAFHYEAKDRNLVRWTHWVHRQVQLAEALPADFGPDQAPGELGRDRLLSDAYRAHGSVLHAQGRLAEAQGWWERALDLLNAEQDARARAGLVGEPKLDRLFGHEDPRVTLLDRLAAVCGDLGDTTAMMLYWGEARELRSVRPTSESTTSSAVEWGDAALDGGDFDAALNAFHRALDQAEEDAPTQVVPRALATTLNALGRCHHRLQLNRSALAYFNRARRLNERSGNAVRLTWDFLEIGRVYRARPDLGEAREALEQSLRNASIPGTPADELSWTGHDGLTYRVTAANRAWASLLELGGLLEDRGDLASAVAFLDLATRIADVVRASAVDDAQRVALANQRIEAFAALTRLHLRRALAGGPDAESAAEDAWRANEAMRARSFLDALGDDELVVPPAVTPALAEQEAAALDRRRRLIASGAHDVAFWDELGRVQAELEAVWDGMMAVAPTAAGYVEVRRSRPATATDVGAVIAADHRPTVLASVTALGVDRLAVIALRSDSSRPVIASQPADLARLARFVNENLGTVGRVRELATDLEDLFHYEMQPLTAALAEISSRDEILIVSPFGALNYVPLAALHVDNTPLVERNPLAVLPSASLARALRVALGTPPPIAAMVLGDPTGDLRGAREEAAAVAALFATTAVLGTEVSRATVREALTSAGTVHIAAHAHFDAQDPLSSGMRLADGVLPAHEIIMMSAPALSLVTLSACETGVSQTNPAQELLGLTRALLFAGADSLVVSLWKVPDAATVDIMSAFYGRLQQRAWKVDALQAAALAARDRYGAQRFDQWAGFQLVGEWR